MATNYDSIIKHVFAKRFEAGAALVRFTRDDLVEAAIELGLERPKNIGDIVYTYRYRRTLPAEISDKVPVGKSWIIRPDGDARYKFVAVEVPQLHPTRGRIVVKIPDSTPALVAENALTDEQALLAVLRYNRLIDTFLRITCYSLQNHLRTKVPNVGQVEVDELYLGIDRRGVQYVVPVQAKGGRDKLSVVQIEQDMEFCRHRFPHLQCKPVGAQFLDRSTVALMEFDIQDEQVVIASEAHFQLVPKGEVRPEDFERYRMLPED